MKKIITLLGLVLLSHANHVCADSTEISSFLDSDCDNYFDNPTGFILTPEKNLQAADPKAFTVTYLSQDDTRQHFLKAGTGNLRQVNLYCFALPRVIEASVKPQRTTLKMAMEGLALPSSPTTNGAAMCCFVSYPFEKTVITA